jgi:hypothetical protein
VVGIRGAGGEGGEGFTGRTAIGYDHIYDAELYHLELAIDENHIKGFVEG